MGNNKVAMSSILMTLLLIFVSQIGYVSAGNGVDENNSSGVGDTDSIAGGFSNVQNIANGYDNSQSSFARMFASGEFSGMFTSTCASQSTTAYSQITYTLEFQSNINQTLEAELYSETQHDFSSGWSTVTGLEMSAVITDNAGTWTAWQSSTPDNSFSPSPSTVSFGQLTPRVDNTVEVVMRIQHDGVWEDACEAELRVYDFISDALVPPVISYSGSPYTMTEDVGISPINPINTGGAASSWSISSGSLPQGLSLSSTSGSITGTPTSAGGPVSVTIEATNSAGSDSETISITVNEQLPDIDYTGSPYSFTKGNPISTITPTNSGGIASSWSIISGSMPSGLAFDSLSGEITGTPTVVTNSASITIQASNSAGSHSDTISITVNDIAPSIDYLGSPFTFTKDVTISAASPTNNGGTATSWSIISGSLPSGLSFSSSSGTISGTPTQLVNSASITIRAINSGGSDTATISITVNDDSPSISYSGTPYTLTKDLAISPIIPTNNGGQSSSWSITSGSLPSGLQFASSTGIISGTPTDLVAGETLTIMATNTGGSDSSSIQISVVNQVPIIGYFDSSYTFTIASEITPINPILSGGPVNSWSITSGTLPNGLSISPISGIITGTPSELASNVDVTILGTNDQGSDTVTISITVNDIIPSVSYPSNQYQLYVGVEISPILPINNGGTPVTWSIVSGQLPNGLNFNSQNGVISGTPLVEYSLAQISVQATNTGGTDTIIIGFEIFYQTPSISYPDNPFNIINDTTLVNIMPINNGGPSTQWSLDDGILPAGLSLNGLNGVITGTAIVIGQQTFTIMATNSGGSASFVVTIIVSDSDFDNDGVLTQQDSCPNGESDWTSNGDTDFDSDGCQDSGEDTDDDNDYVNDTEDYCNETLGLTVELDVDRDGCEDFIVNLEAKIIEVYPDVNIINIFEHPEEPLPTICRLNGEKNQTLICNRNPSLARSNDFTNRLIVTTQDIVSSECPYKSFDFLLQGAGNTVQATCTQYVPKIDRYKIEVNLDNNSTDVTYGFSLPDIGGQAYFQIEPDISEYYHNLRFSKLAPRIDNIQPGSVPITHQNIQLSVHVSNQYGWDVENITFEFKFDRLEVGNIDLPINFHPAGVMEVNLQELTQLDNILEWKLPMNHSGLLLNNTTGELVIFESEYDNLDSFEVEIRNIYTNESFFVYLETDKPSEKSDPKTILVVTLLVVGILIIVCIRYSLIYKQRKSREALSDRFMR